MRYNLNLHKRIER